MVSFLWGFLHVLLGEGEVRFNTVRCKCQALHVRQPEMDVECLADAPDRVERVLLRAYDLRALIVLDAVAQVPPTS